MKFPEMLTGVQHIGVPTNDLEKTVAFYETIGFQPVLETVNEAANERVTFLQLKNLVIETYENHAAVGSPAPSTTLRSTRQMLKRRSQRRRKRGLRCSTTRFTGCRFGRTA